MTDPAFPANPGKGQVWTRPDTLLALALAVAAAIWCMFLFGQFRAFFYADKAMNIWFDADVPRVLGNMLDRSHGHQATAKHPIFSVLAWTPVSILRATGIDAMRAVSLLLAANAAVFGGLLFYLLRMSRLDRAQAVPLTIATLASAASTSFLGLTETFAFGATSILLGLLPLAWLANGRPVGMRGWIFSVAASLSITVTNIGVGAAALLVGHLQPLVREREAAPFYRAFRRMIVIGACACAIVLAIAIVQDIFFGDAGLFINAKALGGETKFTTFDVGGLGDRLQILVTGPWVSGPATMPPLTFEETGHLAGGLGTTPFLRAGLPTILTGLGWLALLVTGAVAAVRDPANMTGRGALLALAGMLALHAFYGFNPSLYLMHLVPLEALVIACSAAYLRRAFAPVLLCLTVATAFLAYQFHLGALDAAQRLFGSY